MIKLIGLDLDGTVLNADKKITDKNREALERCREKGIHIVPVTGRPYSGIYEEYKRDLNCDYTISTNGAAVTEVETDRRIISHTMNEKTCYNLMDILRNFDCYFGVFCDGYGYLEEKNYRNELNKFKNTPLYEYVKRTRRIADDYYKLLSRRKECDNIYVIAENTFIREKICDSIKNVDDIYFTCSDYNDVEIGGNCSKGSTLQELARKLGIKSSEIMAIGDSGNDYKMLESAGLSVAMENADNRIKEISDFVTKSCEESGVAFAIEKFVL